MLDESTKSLNLYRIKSDNDEVVRFKCENSPTKRSTAHSLHANLNISALARTHISRNFLGHVNTINLHRFRERFAPSPALITDLIVGLNLHENGHSPIFGKVSSSTGHNERSLGTSHTAVGGETRPKIRTWWTNSGWSEGVWFARRRGFTVLRQIPYKSIKKVLCELTAAARPPVRSNLDHFPPSFNANSSTLYIIWVRLADRHTRPLLMPFCSHLSALGYGNRDGWRSALSTDGPNARVGVGSALLSLLVRVFLEWGR